MRTRLNLIDTTVQILNQLKLNVDYKLRPADFTLASIFILAGLRSSDRHWLQITTKLFANQNQFDREYHNQNASPVPIDFIYSLLHEHLPNELFFSKFDRQFRQLNGAKDLYECIPCWRFRDVPLSAWNSLLLWRSRPQLLELRFDVPTPIEVLNMQTLGKRCVTIFCDPKQLAIEHDHHRDAFLFTIHDLEHAWKFFSSKDLYQLQVQWACFLQKTFIKGPWKSYIDERLKSHFNYLISDMNSHPWHSFLTLKNMFLQSFKLKSGHQIKKNLMISEDLVFQSEWSAFLSDCGLPELEQRVQKEQAQYFLNHLRLTENTQV